MGADLICFICKGPAILDMQMKSAAVEKAKAVIDTIKKLIKIYDKHDGDEKLLKKVDLSPLSHFQQDVEAKRSITIKLEEIPEIDEYRYLTSIDGKSVV